MPTMVPFSLEEAVSALDLHPHATLLAGGTDLVVEVNAQRRHLDDDAVVIALNRVAELRSWVVEPDRATVTIGAGVTWGELERPPFLALTPALAEAARTVGSRQIRATGTIGGNLATCSPAGDGLPVLAALDAIVHTAGPNLDRKIPVTEFMIGVKRTALQPGELITAVEVPILDGFQGYRKVGIRNAMVISLAGVCLVTDRASQRIRVALGSVGPTVLRCPRAESLLSTNVDWGALRLGSGVVDEAVELVRTECQPITDHRSTAEYRLHAVGVLTRRLLGAAFEVDGV